MGRTLFDKVWESHIVRRAEGRPDLLYVDLHLVHEVTSPQPFETLPQRKPRSLRIRFVGEPAPGVPAKDYVLAAIGHLGVDGGVGHVIEYAGPAVEALTMEGRLTICNMSIEAGARAGLIAPDDVTFQDLAGRPRAPAGFDAAGGRRGAPP